MSIKPLGGKSYGSIGHLPDSRMGPGDHKIPEGQSLIATVKKRDKNDEVIIQEKLDGSNMGIAIKNDNLYALTRSGYEALTSMYPFHHLFHDYVYQNEERIHSVINEGERISGEWLIKAHSTKYNLPHEPFVAFDIFDKDNKRLPYDEFVSRIDGKFQLPFLVHRGDAMSVSVALSKLGYNGQHGALEEIEGVIYRVERFGKVDFLCKYVRPNKIDGKYFEGEVEILNQFTNDIITF